MIFGRELNGIDDITRCAVELQKEGARNVLVSLAGDGALLIDEFGNILRQAAPKGEVINSVGAGDSMVAGFLAGLLKVHDKNKEQYDAQDYEYALKLGVAAGSASAFTSAFPDKKMIEKVEIQMGL
jgi:1-phosphofructokinase